MSELKRVDLKWAKSVVDDIDKAIEDSGGVIQNRSHFLLLASFEKLKSISELSAGVKDGI